MAKTWMLGIPAALWGGGLPGLRRPSGLSPTPPPDLLGPQPLCALELGPVLSQETFQPGPSLFQHVLVCGHFLYSPLCPQGSLS